MTKTKLPLSKLYTAFADYSGQVVTVNAGETGFTLVEPIPRTFIELNDVPSDYTGHTLQSVRVNVGESGLEFYTPSTDADTLDGTHSSGFAASVHAHDGTDITLEFTELTDVPSDYTGHTLQSVRVNVGESGLEFYTPSTDADTLDGTHSSGFAASEHIHSNYQDTSARAQANGYASLDGSAKIPQSQLPALAITDVYSVADETSQLALNATTDAGDVCIRSDINKSFIRNDGTAGTMADWYELLTPTDLVLSVNGEVGAVILSASDITFNQTGDITSVTVQAAIEEVFGDKANLSHDHAGGDITSAVANADDADTLDGTHSSGFAASVHAHDNTDLTIAFTELTDTPNAYTSVGGHLVRVTEDATGLEFYDLTYFAGTPVKDVYSVEATEGQTDFNLTFNYTMTSKEILVFSGGLYMLDGVDYTEDTTSKIVFLTGRDLGENVVVIHLETLAAVLDNVVITTIYPDVVDVYPDAMSLDSVDTGSDYGTMFGMIKSVNFDPDEKGTVQINFTIPDSWGIAKDLKIKFVYTVNGGTADESCDIEVSVQTVDAGDTPVVATPDTTTDDVIVLSAANINKLQTIELTNGFVENANLTVNTKVVALKITRDGVSDNCTGTLQISSVQLYKAA